MKTFSDNIKLEKFRENIFLYQNDSNVKSLYKVKLYKGKSAFNDINFIKSENLNSEVKIFF